MSTTSVTVRGFVATTDPIPSLHGHSLPHEVLYTFAEAIRKGSIPMGLSMIDNTIFNHAFF